MASLGHIAVGAAAARVYGAPPSTMRQAAGAVIFWSALSFLPDADVIAFSFGIPYEAEWGHRGATHSFVFALVVGALVGLAARPLNYPAFRTGAAAMIVLATHPLLDTLTDGGLGCALFWPFDQTRYFAPWRPIPVSPIGLAFISPYGLFVAFSEAMLFTPVWWFAFRARRGVSGWRGAPRLAAFASWCVMLWLLMSTDPLRERILAIALRDSTEFSAAFSEQVFAAVTPGQTEQEVRARLGAPFREIPFEPDSSCWAYSRSRSGGFFRVRAVCFVDGRVDEVVRRWVRE